MSFVSLRLSTITMFPLPNFQFFTTVFLSHSHINQFLFKLYNISTNVHSRYDHPIIYNNKKLVQYYLFSIFFNQGLGFTILRRHQLFLSDIFKVKSAIGWPLRWTKCTNRNDLFSPFLFGILTFSLCEVIFLFSFPNFLKILTFVTLNWLRPRLGERNGMERNEKNHFRIFSHSLVWEFWWREWKAHSLVWEFKWEGIKWVGGNTHSSLFS